MIKYNWICKICGWIGKRPNTMDEWTGKYPKRSDIVPVCPMCSAGVSMQESKCQTLL
jgi:hypothetical protein